MNNNYEKIISAFDLVNIDRIDALLGDIADLDEDEWVFDDVAQLRKEQNLAKFALVGLAMVASGELCAEGARALLLCLEETMRKKE